MQTLLIRLTRSRCFFKSSKRQFSSAALARPSVATPVRVGADNLVAAFFATAAFTSAVVDSARKDAKKKEWARVIKEARRELHTLEAEQERRLSALEQTGHHDRGEEKEDLTCVRQKTWEEILRWGNQELRERKELGFDNWRGVPLSLLRNASPEQIQDILDNHANHFFRFRGLDGFQVWNSVTWPLHIRKLKTIEWSIAKLVLKFMWHVPDKRLWLMPSNEGFAAAMLADFSWDRTEEDHPARKYAQEHLDNLSEREQSDEYYLQYPSPKFPRYSDHWGEDLSSADELNAKLNDLFESQHKLHHSALDILPSICYYLVTSKVPPDIHTYNLLFSEFTGAGQDKWVQDLMISMWETHMRPNEITVAEVLRYFVRKDDRFRFDRHIDAMDGFTRGLAVAKPEEVIPDLFKFQYRVRVLPFHWKEKGVCDSYYELRDLSPSDIQALKEKGDVKIYLKPRRNQEVYRALIEGALHFYGLSGAMEHYEDMVSEGWSPDEELFSSLLDCCVGNRDFEVGLTIWKHLHASYIPVSEHGYLLMIRLCQLCKQEKMIGEILEKGICEGVLPPTVQEIHWGLSPNESFRNLWDKYGHCHDAWVIKQGLEKLMHQAQKEDDVSPQSSTKIDMISHEIGTSLSHPSSKTAALLMEARIYVLTAKFEHSKQQLLDFAGDLYDVWFSKRVDSLGRAVRKLKDQISSVYWETSLIMDTLSHSMPSLSLGNFKTTSSFIEVQISKSRVTVQSIALGVKALMMDIYGEAMVFDFFEAAKHPSKSRVEPNAGALAQQKRAARKPVPHSATSRLPITRTVLSTRKQQLGFQSRRVEQKNVVQRVEGSVWKIVRKYPSLQREGGNVVRRVGASRSKTVEDCPPLEREEKHLYTKIFEDRPWWKSFDNYFPRWDAYE
ncbi:MAG: hypothetical protein LQ350_005566 [Teloschistes chrysophthalmus]|nr:MAG: hypothetical protein LQ350_005566 [Niorma chrysophthalma]